MKSLLRQPDSLNPPAAPLPMTDAFGPVEKKSIIPLEWVEERGFEVPLHPQSLRDAGAFPNPPVPLRGDTAPPFLPCAPAA